MNIFQQSANALKAGTQGTQQAMNTALGFKAPQMNGMNLQGYMNPYTQNVIDTTMGTMDRQRQQMLGQVGAQATAAGAFGGSRHGLVEAETNRGFADSMGQMTAGLNQSNFQNAQQMGQFDINNKMQGALQGAQIGLQGANQMGNMANLGFGMGQQANQMQGQAGQQQQAIQQAIMNGIQQQFAGFTGAPQQGLAGMIGAVSGAPHGQTTTQTQNPGLLGMLAGGASMLGGLGWAPFCWVARASFGEENPEWLTTREWMLDRAPDWLFNAYCKHGPAVAEWIERHPVVKPVFRAVFRRLVRL